MSDLRMIDPTEILLASTVWQEDDKFGLRGVGGKYSALKFQGITRGWLRFHRLLSKAEVVSAPFGPVLTAYLADMQLIQRLADASVYSYRERIATFLNWLGREHCSLNDISLKHICSYLDHLRTIEWKPRSIAAACNALRDFFRFCERHGWCAPDIA